MLISHPKWRNSESVSKGDVRTRLDFAKGDDFMLEQADFRLERTDFQC